MELLEQMMHRRSVRRYLPGEIPEEALQTILRAGLLSPTGRNLRSWEFLVVREPQMLRRLAQCRTTPVPMLEQGACAIVVLGREDRSDVWTEDCAAAMANMHLMADALGLGSCWVQGRLREAADGRTSEAFVCSLLGFPETCRLEAILALGLADAHPAPHTLEELPLEKLHYETF